jgi:hypothetical protein
MLRYAARLSGSSAVPETSSVATGNLAIILASETFAVAVLELDKAHGFKGIDLLEGPATDPDPDNAPSLLVLYGGPSDNVPHPSSFTTTVTIDPSKSNLTGLLAAGHVHATVFSEANDSTGEIRGQVKSLEPGGLTQN